jgi:hypothetical protein
MIHPPELEDEPMETVAELLATRQSDEVRIVRRKHRVGFRGGCTVQHMLDTLNGLPYRAAIDEMLLHECGDEEILTIEFHEQRREQ